MDAVSATDIADVTAARQFQRELRRWRTRKGLTQRALADRVRFSRETVAAVEAGRRFGSQELAIRCDQVLGTGGRLAELWPMVAEEQAAADGRRGPRGTGAERSRPAAGVDPEAPDRQTVVAAIDELRGLIDQMIRGHLQSDEDLSSVRSALARADLSTSGAEVPAGPAEVPAVRTELPAGGAEVPAGRAESPESGVEVPRRPGERAVEPSAERRKLAGGVRRGRTGATRWRG